MKKKFYFATLVIALLTFTGCANDEYVGDQQNLGEQNAAIAFSTKSENTVRATWEHDKAAEKLNKQFWVYGTKKVNGVDKPVFNNYKVTYKDGTTSLSNTSGWEYVNETNPTQTIKYWDYSASQYDFEAYSIQKKGSGAVTRNTTANLNTGLAEGDYIVGTVNENECANLYFADKMTVNKTSTTTGPKYGDPVTLTFKSVLSKIRVGFYETIPGYSVKITKFYGPADVANPTDWDAGNDNNFVAWCPNNKIDGEKSFVVSYGSGTTPAITKVYNGTKYQEISSASSEDGYTLNQELTLGSNLIQSEIGETYSAVTWDTDDNGTSKYTYVIPQNQPELCNPSGGVGQVQPMRIKVDYTLTSDNLSGEEIDKIEKIYVKGATAIVPKEYLQWEPNTAYSYVFRISVNTNGNTGTDPNDPAGLYPITFDAVVEDMAENNNYLTTVSELSITATQEAGQFTGADEAAFEKNNDIKVKVMRYYTEGNVLKTQDITSNVGANDENGNSFKAVFKTDYDPSKSLEEYETGMEEKGNTNDVITLGRQSDPGYWIVKVTYRETGENGEKNYTKYAVLKVG